MIKATAYPSIEPRPLLPLAGRLKLAAPPVVRLSLRSKTLIFGTIFFIARLGADWLFRWTLPEHPMPPLWSVALTTSFGTAIATTVVYFLLRGLRAQQEAIGELNHEVRNALQVLSFVALTCDPTQSENAQAAVARMSRALEQVSGRLGKKLGKIGVFPKASKLR